MGKTALARLAAERQPQAFAGAYQLLGRQLQSAAMRRAPAARIEPLPGLDQAGGMLLELFVRTLQVRVAALRLFAGACIHALFPRFQIPILRCRDGGRLCSRSAYAGLVACPGIQVRSRRRSRC